MQRGACTNCARYLPRSSGVRPGGLPPHVQRRARRILRSAPATALNGKVTDQALAAARESDICHNGRIRCTARRCAMAMEAGEIKRLIEARIPDAQVTIQDLAGDGDHYAATVIAESFRGKSRVQQHQIVYEALKAEMGGKLHALALQTGTPPG